MKKIPLNCAKISPTYKGAGSEEQKILPFIP